MREELVLVGIKEVGSHLSEVSDFSMRKELDQAG
jgi:hypothetical protein